MHIQIKLYSDYIFKILIWGALGLKVQTSL